MNLPPDAKMNLAYATQLQANGKAAVDMVDFQWHAEYQGNKAKIGLIGNLLMCAEAGE